DPAGKEPGEGGPGPAGGDRRQGTGPRPGPGGGGPPQRPRGAARRGAERHRRSGRPAQAVRLRRRGAGRGGPPALIRGSTRPTDLFKDGRRRFIMRVVTMGKVIVAAKIENLADLYKVEEGTLSPEQVRRIEVPDALVDTGATMLSLPSRLIDQLGL